MSGGDGLLLALDQGTSSTKAMLVDADGSVVATTAVPVGQQHPRPGWVEQDPGEIWASVRRSVSELLTPDVARRVLGVALSVQRESVVVWERATGAALTPVLGWQDERTRERVRALEPYAEQILARTGLPLDPMFSAVKAGWLLDELDPGRTRAASGQWCLGTLDAWLLAQLGGESVTEIGNASRTQLLDIGTGTWDDSLLDLFGVPAAALPTPVSSVGPFPPVRGLDPLPDGTPVLAVLGDSHAALFAHAGWRPGVVKATYGTGSSVMALGPRPAPDTGVCATIAWQAEETSPVTALALEANIRSSGRTLTWLADLLGVDVAVLLEESATHASEGVTLVPAFGGLGAPWWDADAAPLLTGFALGTQRGHLARAALESIALQVDDVVAAFARTGTPLSRLRCDGGLSRSASLMQLQADLCGIPVEIASTANLSALGVAHLAGVRAGLWTLRDLEARLDEGSDPATAGGTTVMRPRMPETERASARARWADAIGRSRWRGPVRDQSDR